MEKIKNRKNGQNMFYIKETRKLNFCFILVNFPNNNYCILKFYVENYFKNLIDKMDIISCILCSSIIFHAFILCLITNHLNETSRLKILHCWTNGLIFGVGFSAPIV